MFPPQICQVLLNVFLVYAIVTVLLRHLLNAV